MAGSDKTKTPSEYPVGYGRPPARTRFKKGQSGNPKGRPKGSLNLATVLERTLRERVVVNENGRRRELTKLEAAIKQLVNKAALGDPTALRQLLALVASAEERSALASDSTGDTHPADLQVMQSIVRRFQDFAKEASDHETDN